MTDSQAATTRFCARVIGPLMLIIGAIVIARFNELALLIPSLLQDGPLMFVTGLFTLIVGMVLFAAHHHWNNPTAILISLLGVLTIVRGIVLTAAPDLLASFAASMMSASPGPFTGGAVALLIGAWLTFAGWFAKA
jgi:hypothetical protein